MGNIVDVGAYTGGETFKFLLDSEAKVFAFEPESQQFRELLQKSAEFPRLTVLPFAVDIGDNQEPLFHKSDGQSTLDPPMFGTAVPKFTMTWTIRLDTFMYLYSVFEIDYLHVDAPFREEMILESLGNRVDQVKGGRIRRYGQRSVVPAWLLDHGFDIAIDSTTGHFTEPDIRFFRK